MYKTPLLLSLALVYMMVVLAACGPSPEDQDATATQIVAGLVATQTAQSPTQTRTPTVTHTPTSAPTPTPTAVPTETPTPSPLTAAEVFALISPSIAFVETEVATGSGILIEDGYVVTNAHVVWPYQEVRLVFPDGSEHVNVAVINWDLLADLAVLGPVETSLSPMRLVDGESLIVGSDIFFIGYPGEVEHFPQPTIISGIISRKREWSQSEITFLQTDATVAGGQSGGVLVSQKAEVIGMSGLYFSEAGYGLVASSADIQPRLRRLIAGEDVSALGERQIPLKAGRPNHDAFLRSFWDAAVYVLNEPVGTSIQLEVNSLNDAYFEILDVFGNLLISVDDGFSGFERGDVTLEFPGPHFVVVSHFTEDPGTFRVSSSHDLAPYDDVDDGAAVSMGQTLVANMDYPGDFDYFEIDLARGDEVNIRVDSVMFDPYLQVDYVGATDLELVADDDSGGGMFGLDAELTYRAPHDGSYWIVVSDSFLSDVGGYLLTVSEPYPGAPTPAAPPPTATPISSPFGELKLYHSAQHPFAIQYPSAWTEQPPDETVTAFFVAEDGASLTIAEKDMVQLGYGEVTSAEYADLLLSVVATRAPGFHLITRQQLEILDSEVAEVITYSAQDGRFKGKQFIFVYQNRLAFSAAYSAPATLFEELEPLIDYSFTTFQVTE